ncbi:Putative RNA-binding protein 11 [Melipona quadrifasciata]|uniref:Putative RNA-binding protein 11 n=1 Tax=Melipona quadrifasciata TaxID=166423 RepID=A0A0M8ZUP3_9HYME|nr:Putative RNA-binding protein 11 [Melipona quadrifasciata]
MDLNADEGIRTIWCGNLSTRTTEEILYELFLQGGPIQRVSIPKDRDGKQRPYGFITYKHLSSVSYALELFDGTALFNRTLNIRVRRNVELQQTNSQDANPIHPANSNEWLILGQEILLGSDVPHLRRNSFVSNMICGAPLKYSDFLSSSNDKDDRRSRRMHPYQRERDHKSTSHHRDHNSSRHYRHSRYKHGR